MSDSWPRIQTYYYVVDSHTKASVLAESLAQSPANESHYEFVVIDEEHKQDSLQRLDLALMELSQAGVTVQVLDLR